MSFYSELKRRNVFRVAIGYIVMAWLVMQVADVILNNVEAPGWVFHVLMFFLAVGFAFAVFFAWAFELTPEGLKREHEVDRSQSITRQTGRKLDYTIIGILALALGYFAYDKFVISAQREAALVEAAAQAAGEQASAVTDTSGIDAQSVAVLPFINMSSDPEQEYFSDGLSEELLNLLAKIPELKVASRSSAFQFKGEKIDVSEVAQKLKVAHVLEGSVRKAGNQLRITAQLIKADDGYHMWSETYDRSLDNIFAIQDEISAAVVDALKIELLGEAPKAQAVNPEAYALLLKARHIYAKWGKDNFEKALAALQEALAIEPEYAEVWASMSSNYLTQVQYGYRDRDEGVALSREAAEKALEIDPNHGPAWGKLASIHAADFDWAGAEAATNRAVELAPRNASTLTTAANLASNLGRFEEALALHQRILDDDPLQLIAHFNYASTLMKMGRLEESAAAFRHLLELNPEDWGSRSMLALVYLMQGNPEAAMEEAALEVDPVSKEFATIAILPALGREQEARARLEDFTARIADRSPYTLATIHGWLGDRDEAFRWLNQAVDQRDVTVADAMTDAMLTGLRDDPRWPGLLARIGLPY